MQGDLPHKRNSKAILLDKDTILKAIHSDKTQYERRFTLQKLVNMIRHVKGTIFKAMCLAVVTQGDNSCSKCALLRIQISINEQLNKNSPCSCFPLGAEDCAIVNLQLFHKFN